jgi:hypothetical protein
MSNTNQTSGVGAKGYKGATVYDKVEVTPSGHVFRTNDEAGKEEILRLHTTGTFERFDPSGGRTLQVVGHNYTAYLSGSQLVVEGACNITVMGDCNLNVGPKEDPETGEKSGGNFKVEAENIYLNSRKSTNISAGTDMKIETRSTSEDRKEPGGNIDIISANAYQLKVFGEATERFEKSLETHVIKKYDLTIGGDYAIGVKGGSEDEENGGEYEGNMLTDVKGQASIIAKNKLKLASNDEAFLTANKNLEVRTEQQLDFHSTNDTIFNSDNLTVESGPVHIVEEVTADSTITADGEIKSNDDVTTSRPVSLNNHTHLQTDGNDRGGGAITTPPIF